VGYGSSGRNPVRPAPVDIALWDLWGKAVDSRSGSSWGGSPGERVRVYNTCAGYSYNKAGGRRLVSDGAAPGRGPYEDRWPSCSARRSWPGAADMGISAMKIWPFDVFAEPSGGASISAEDLEEGAGAVPKDPRGRG